MIFYYIIIIYNNYVRNFGCLFIIINNKYINNSIDILLIPSLWMEPGGKEFQTNSSQFSFAQLKNAIERIAFVLLIRN